MLEHRFFNKLLGDCAPRRAGTLYNLSVRILLLNLYYPPDTSATAKMAQSVAEALAAAHRVTVLCGRPSYDPSERRPWRPFQTERLGVVRIIRAGSTDFSRLDMNKRVLNYLSYVCLAIPRALLVPSEVILAMTDPPFQGLVGAIVAMRYRAAAVKFDFHHAFGAGNDQPEQGSPAFGHGRGTAERHHRTIAANHTCGVAQVDTFHVVVMSADRTCTQAGQP